MQRNASALPFLLALAITRAHGEALFTDPIATNSANAPLIWLNRETTAATTLTLTREPDGGDTIAVIPRGGSITALMRDADGHTLAKTPFGITGWAQAQAGEDSGETFPALALRHDDTLNIDLYYHPQLGKTQNNHYYYNEAEPDTPSPGLPPDPAADEPAPHYTTYDRLLETALKADGARYHIDCSAGASGDYHCLFLNAAQGKIRRTNVAGLPGQTFYIPGNGAIYSDTDDSNSRYYRVRQKWTLHNGTALPLPRPCQPIPRHPQSRQRRARPQNPAASAGAHRRQKNRGKNCSGRAATPPPRRPEPALCQRRTTGRQRPLRRPVAAHPKQRRQNRLGENQLPARHPRP